VVIFYQLYLLAGGVRPFGHAYTAKALLPETFNLVQRSDVRAAGVPIGHVDSLAPAGNLGEVTFEIDKPVPLYNDATVEVRTKTLVGETYLEVNPGSPRTGRLPSGSVLPVAHTDNAVNFDQIFNALDPATRAEVRRTMAGLGRGLDGRGDDLNNLLGALHPAVSNGGELMQVLRPQDQQLAALMDQTGTVMSAITQRTDQVRQVIGDMRTTAKVVSARDAELGQALDLLPSTLNQAHRTVTDLGSFSAHATPVVSNLRIASVALTPAIRDLEPTARAGRELFAELRPFLRAFNPLVDSLTPAANSLSAMVPALDALLRQASPAVSYLEPFSHEVGSFFSNVGAEANTRDAVGNLIRVHAVIGPDQYTNMPTGVRKAEQALIQTGALEQIYNPRSNAYPQTGTATSPNSSYAFGASYPHLSATPPNHLGGG
jgi:phospholipid/cholesterol/gamma-HCH transport system substrate-binding protein